MNHIIKTLIVADIGLLTAVGFVVPIFAIFITNTIQGGDIQVVGFAAAIYWIVKSSVTIPFGQYLDRNHGEKDDLYFVIVGGVIAAVSVLDMCLPHSRGTCMCCRHFMPSAWA